MVKIRLRRIGKKGAPTYRVVVADSRSPRDGRFIENIGSYNPGTEPSAIAIDGPRALEWIGKGAQPTPAVSRLLEVSGVMERQPKPATRHA
ncbi:MAG TPA: 30S ribosomal protein S16 [Actinomycetota bacterium]|nr:30S ribosomal protein S16 [Actinomycetota bacterium]